LVNGPLPHRVRDDEAYYERLAILEVENDAVYSMGHYNSANEDACRTRYALAMTAAFHGDWREAWQVLLTAARLGDEVAVQTLAELCEKVFADRRWEESIRRSLTEKKPKG